MAKALELLRVTIVSAGITLALAIYLSKNHLQTIHSIPLLTWWILAISMLALGLPQLFRTLRKTMGTEGIVHKQPFLLGTILGIGMALAAMSETPLLGEVLESDYNLAINCIGWTLFGGGVVILNLFALPAWSLHRDSANDVQSSGIISETNSSPCDNPAHALSLESLMEWIRTDNVVENSCSDLFEHATIAKRIAKRIDLDPPPSQIVLGPLGSGKSSLGKLVEQELRGKLIDFVQIELWPYDNTESAVKAVISALIQALQKHGDISALRGLPEKYVELVSSTGNFWGALIRVLQPSKTPIEYLAEIDQLATTRNRKIVLWVDDLERFAGGNATSTNPETLKESERLNPLRALLYGLDRLRSVSVIVATTDLHLRIDVHKIARFVEYIPELNPETVAQLLNAFRERWKSEGFEDPLRNRNRFFWHQETSPDRDFRSLPPKVGWSPGESCIVLCRTPRILKQVLRLSDETWTRLPGEIDYDAMLAMNCIREAVPRAFSLINTKIGQLRCDQVWRGSPDEDDDEQADPQELALRQIEESASSPEIGKAIYTIARKCVVETKLPQGFSIDTHTDYWRRYISAAPLQPNARDQPTLKAIKSADIEALTTLLLGENPGPLRTYGRRLNTSDLLALVTSTMRSLIEADFKQSSDTRPSPEIDTISSIIKDKTEISQLSNQDVQRIVISAYSIVVPKRLSLTLAIETEIARNYLRQFEHYNATKQALFSLLAEHFIGKPELLAQRLEETPTNTISALCWERRPQGEAIGGPSFSFWPEFSRTLLDAARKEPNTVLPHIAGLITKSSTHECKGSTPEFEPGLCQAMFGNASSVLALFKAHANSDFRDPAVKAVQDAALSARPSISSIE